MKLNFKACRGLFGVFSLVALICGPPVVANAQQIPEAEYGAAAGEFSSTYGTNHLHLPENVYGNANSMNTVYNGNSIMQKVFVDNTLVYVKTYSYDVMIGREMYTVDVPIGENVIDWVKAPTKDGYTFLGWKTDTSISPDGIVTNLRSQNDGAHTLYPVFSKQVTVTLVDGANSAQYSGTKYNVASVDGQAPIMLPTFSHGSGYDLIGYSRSSTSTSEADVLFKPGTNLFSENTTLYAMYRKPTVTVTIKTGGADIINTGRGVYNNGSQTDATITLGTASLNGWTLRGYRTDTATNTTPQYNAGQTTTFANNMTLYAVYTANEQTDLTSTKTVTFTLKNRMDGTESVEAGSARINEGSSPTSISATTHYYYTEVYNAGNGVKGKINESKPAVNIAGKWSLSYSKNKDVELLSNDTWTQSYFDPDSVDSSNNPTHLITNSGTFQRGRHYSFSKYNTNTGNVDGNGNASFSGLFNYDTNSVNMVVYADFTHKDYTYGFTGMIKNLTSPNHGEAWYPGTGVYLDPSQTVTFYATREGARSDSIYTLFAANWGVEGERIMSYSPTTGYYQFSINGLDFNNKVTGASVRNTLSGLDTWSYDNMKYWGANKITYYVGINITKPVFHD